jgi:hypothetical protein
MLSPEIRSVAMDMLRAPAGYRIDQAALTTYSLDLDVLLALPLAVLAQSDRSLDELLEDPLLLLEALREAGDRVHVFVDEGGIAIPGTSRALFAMLEQSVHPMRALNGGAFHPKVWLVRFQNEDGDALLRVAVSSRNLTFDRSWDIALVSEAAPARGPIIKESRALAELMRSIPRLALRKLSKQRIEVLESLAAQVERIAFPAPEGFTSPVAFEALGLAAGIKSAWRPKQAGEKVLVISPFVNVTGLDALAATSTGGRILVSRQESLDELSEDALSGWKDLMVLSETAVGEQEDSNAARPSGLHAKIIAVENGRQISWTIGSANATAAAFTGRNVELIASMTGPRSDRGKNKGFGIDQFRDSGFLALCEPYRRIARPDDDHALTLARTQLETARCALLESNLKVSCRINEDTWRWTLSGDLSLPPEVKVEAWPVSVNEDQARLLQLPSEWSLPLPRLTAFVAFRLSVAAKVDDVRMVLKLPTEGMPEGRVMQVLRMLIDSPERFMQFLRALLGGLEGLADWAVVPGDGASQGKWFESLGGETLLEDLIRTASREPQRLEPIRRLIEDLRSTVEGRAIVPDDFYDLWRMVDEVVSGRRKSLRASRP